MNKKEKQVLFYFALVSLLVCICFTSFVGCRRNDAPPVHTSGSDTSVSDTTTDFTTTSDLYSETDTTTPNTSETSDTASSTPDVNTTLNPPETTTLPAPISSEGSFKMDTGTSLGFMVDWSLDRFEDGFAYIDVKVSLNTYELHVSQRKNLGVINFGEESIRFSTDRISYDGKKPTEIVLTFVQVAIPADGSLAVAYLEGKWFFNGNYANVEYDWLSAGGYICVQKP